MIFLSVFFSVLSFAGDLDGHWKQDCARGYLKEEHFLGDSATYTEHNFRDLSCLTPSVDSVSRGTLVPGNPLLDPLGASELDFVFSSVGFTPRDQAAADFYESISLCGLTGWKVNEEKDITGLVCEFFAQGLKMQVPAAGTRKFGIVKREGDSLFFGKLSPERDGSTPFTRPRELDPAAYKLVR